MPDLEQVRAAQAGDLLALSAVVDALAPYVGRLCGSIALDRGADAAQDALIQILRDLPGLREPKALLAWARRVATRESIRHARRGRGREADPDVLERLPRADDPELAGDVRRVLERLAPEQRAILVMRDLEGLSEQEAAAELGVAKGTVKSRLFRARRAFRERWDE